MFLLLIWKVHVLYVTRQNGSLSLVISLNEELDHNILDKQ